MDKELAQQFQKKNLEILKNKLKLDVNNNMETLTLSLNHILDLEVSSAMTKIASIYFDSGAEFVDGDQKKLLVSLGERYLEETKQYLKLKKADLLSTVEQIDFGTDIDQYCQVIERAEVDFDEFLREQLSSYIDLKIVGFIRKLNKKYVNLEQQEFVMERMIHFLKDNFSRRLSSKTVEQMEIRNQTLINNARDNYEHYVILPTNI